LSYSPTQEAPFIFHGRRFYFCHKLRRLLPSPSRVKQIIWFLVDIYLVRIVFVASFSSQDLVVLTTVAFKQNQFLWICWVLMVESNINLMDIDIQVFFFLLLFYNLNNNKNSNICFVVLQLIYIFLNNGYFSWLEICFVVFLKY
jgi:hypothetical protein